MAQWSAQGTHNSLVAGSNPARPTKSNMRSIRYRSLFSMYDMWRFREYLNRYGFSPKVAVERSRNSCYTSSCQQVRSIELLQFGMHNTRCAFSPLAFLSTALSRVRTGRLLQSVYETDFRYRLGFFSPLAVGTDAHWTGRYPLDGHFLCIFRAAMLHIWIYRKIGSDIGYHR